MQLHLLFSLALSFFCSSAAAATDTTRYAEIQAWPLSAPAPQTFAIIGHTSTEATIRSYTSLTIPSNEEIVRVGFKTPSGEWSGIATAASNFAPGKPKRLQLHVRPNGELYHVGFKVAEGVSQGKGVQNTKDELSVEVVKIQPGPTPQLNKPIVVTADGNVEQKEPEKTFLQKYWWAIALFLLFQVVMGGGSKE